MNKTLSSLHTPRHCIRRNDIDDVNLLFFKPQATAGLRYAREKGEVLRRAVLTLRLVSHAQPARFRNTCLLRIMCSWFGNPPRKWLLKAGLLGARPLFPK